MFIYTCTQLFLYNIIQSHDNVKRVACFHKHTAILGDIPTAVKMVWKKHVAGRKNVGVCQYLQNVHVLKCVAKCLTQSVHFFGSPFGIVVGADIGEADILLLCALLVAYFSLHVEANHQLVDHHTDDGAKEWGTNGHQEPAASSPEE